MMSSKNTIIILKVKGLMILLSRQFVKKSSQFCKPNVCLIPFENNTSANDDLVVKENDKIVDDGKD